MEIEVFIAKLKAEMDDPNWMVKDQASVDALIQSVFDTAILTLRRYIVYGRKPLQ